MSHPHIRVIDTALYINRSQNEIGKAPPQSKNFSTAKSKASYSSEPAPLRLAAGKTASLSVIGVQKKGRTQTRSALKHDKTVKLSGEPKKSRRDKKAVTHRSKNVSVLVCIVIVPSSHFLFLSPRCFRKISAITQFTLLLYKVYHCFLTFSSVQDIFLKNFFNFLNFGCRVTENR